jgi:hypothetical protein
VNARIRLQIYLFLLAVSLHLIWEVTQIEAYDFPETSLTTVAIGCFVPSLGDGLMTLIIYWVLRPGIRGYLSMMSTGLLLAVAVEWNALYLTGSWAYSERMFIVPVLGVGVLPVMQMLLLPPITILLLQWIWRNRRTVK